MVRFAPNSRGEFVSIFDACSNFVKNLLSQELERGSKFFDVDEHGDIRIEALFDGGL